jgi:hypothetical protein
LLQSLPKFRNLTGCLYKVHDLHPWLFFSELAMSYHSSKMKSMTYRLRFL